MYKKHLLLFSLIIMLPLLLVACGEETESDADMDEEQTEDTNEDTEASADNEDESNNSEETENENESAEPVEATPISEVENTISFQRINWIMGSPSRQPEAGIWLYTEENHPDSLADTLNFEDEDVLLYQVSDEAYRGHVLRAQRIILEDDNVVRIVVNVHSEPDEDEDPEDLKMPRQYLYVDKGVLDGKSFIIETEDGETLSLN